MRPIVAYRRLKSRLAQAAAERTRRWSRRRHGPDHGAITIGRRRVYILPTRFGLLFGAMLVVMLLAGLNYNNNLVLAYTFLLAGVGWASLHLCHNNLANLAVSPTSTRSPHANEPAWFGFELKADSARHDLILSVAGVEQTALSLDANEPLASGVFVPTHRRGFVTLRHLTIESTFPLGLFRTWTWLYPERRCLVYPQPLAGQDTPPSSLTNRGAITSDGRGTDEEDLHGLRPFRPGDAPKRIAWKIWARNDTLVTREFAGGLTQPQHLDLATTPGTDLEERLSRLSSWIIDLDTRGVAWSLQVGCNALPLGIGAIHRSQSLALLATYGLPQEQGA